jgi:hypothetical protein
MGIFYASIREDDVFEEMVPPGLEIDVEGTFRV